jgi:hypothetical protein
VKRRASAKEDEAAKVRRRVKRRRDFFMVVPFIVSSLTIITRSTGHASPPFLRKKIGQPTSRELRNAAIRCGSRTGIKPRK